MAAPSRRWARVAAIGAAVVFFAVVPLIGWFARVWTDYLWFDDLGQADVFVTRIVSQLVVGFIFALLAFGLLYGNMLLARRYAPKMMPIGFPEGTPDQLASIVEQLRTRFSPMLSKAILIVAAWLAFFNGLRMSAEWEVFRIALQRVRFDVLDPQFGIDVGFYVFSLPALEAVGSWLTGILILTIVLTFVVDVLDGAIQPWARLRGFAPHVKAHLSVLLAAIVLSQAYSYWLAIWGLNFSPRGQVTGASYTDIYAQLPAYRALIAISVVTAVVLVLNIRYRGWRLPLISLGVWVAASVLLGAVWPGLVQQFRVNPNEATLEGPFIERNIEMTRSAFGLTDLVGKPFPASNTLTADDVLANRDTLENVRLWDPEVIKQGYTQLQTIRSYYEFADVDVDRYDIGGRKRQVLVSARELDTTLLDVKAQNWVNLHLVYTHGFGLVMSPVNDADGRGQPAFIIGNIPPQVSSEFATGTAAADLEIEQPRLYFGERTYDYVVVNTDKEEFDFPQGETNATYQYSAKRGPAIGSLPQRLAWAIRLGSSQVLFSNYVRADSRVLMYRDLQSRLERLAPWLSFEDDAYPVLVDGRIVWIIDAYTVSDRYPYSQALDNGLSYLRNSVKVTVDAYSGETTLYAFDESDPVLQAWRSVFPTLITPGEEIPDAIREHFRYPEGLFSAQAEVYRTYHMTDVNVFYNKEDQWEIPGQRQGRPMAPFFVLLRLPGAESEHFYLMQPYTPRNRDNMIGWIAASSDPENYGDRTVFLFPKERVIQGPEQVKARINQDPAISPQLTLWGQGGSEVIFGNMQVIPIEESIVYVQPIFLQAEQTAIPELTRVVVIYADKVEMERDLESALLKVFGEQPPDATGAPEGEEDGDVAVDAAAAQRLYDEAIEAQRNGDWAEYGRLIEELGLVLSELAGTEATTTP
jgi:uncharacterized membrane protein (UPF0182 family)